MMRLSRTDISELTAKQKQRALVGELGEESLIYCDRRIPLGYPTMVTPEIGPNARLYYRMKHRDPDFRPGEFFGLHVTSRGDA
jgi:hypothetical protein